MNRVVPNDGTPIGQFISVNRCDHGMFHFHQMNGLRYALWLIPIYRQRSACCNGTKSAAACANITENHEGCRTGSPAFAHIRAIATFTNRVEFVGVDQPTNVLVIFANGKFDTKPIRFFRTGIFSRNNRKFDHGAKLTRLFASAKQERHITLEKEIAVVRAR